MKTTNSYALHFVARPKKAIPEELLIYARITVGKEVAEISLKRTVNLSCWDQTKSCVKGNKRLAQDFKQLFEDVRYQLTDCFRRLQSDRRTITAKTLKDLYLGKDQSNKTLCELITYHNENMKQCCRLER
jgi:hypothetical protein